MIKVETNFSSEEGTTINYGDLFQWVGCNHNEICIMTYTGLVSLEKPKNTYTSSSPKNSSCIKKTLEEGTLKKLPKGTVVTVTYTQD
jgi:hypothetical protein